MTAQKDNAMSMSELQKLIVYYKDNLSEEFMQIDIMFVRKTTSTKRLYKTWMLVCRNRDVEEMLKETLANMERIVKEREIDSYDLEVSADDTIQMIKEEKVINYPQLMSAVTVEYTDENTLTEKTDYDKLDFVVLKISDNSVGKPKPPITILKNI